MISAAQRVGVRLQFGDLGVEWNGRRQQQIHIAEYFLNVVTAAWSSRLRGELLVRRGWLRIMRASSRAGTARECSTMTVIGISFKRSPGSCGTSSLMSRISALSCEKCRSPFRLRQQSRDLDRRRKMRAESDTNLRRIFVERGDETRRRRFPQGSNES